MESELTKSIHEIVEDEFSCFICLEVTVNKELGRTYCCKQYICRDCFDQQKARENKCAHCRNSGSYGFERLNDFSSSLARIENRITSTVESGSILNQVLENHEMETSTVKIEMNRIAKLNFELTGMLNQFQGDLEKQEIESKEKDIQLNYAKEYVGSLLGEREFLRSKIEFLERAPSFDQNESSGVAVAIKEECTFDDAYFIDKHEIPNHKVAHHEVGGLQTLAVFKHNVSVILKTLGEEIMK